MARLEIEDIVAIIVRIWIRNLPRFLALTALLHLPVIAWDVAPLVDPLWNLLRYYYDLVPLPVSRLLPSGDLAVHACMVAVVTHRALVALTGNPGPIGRGLVAAVHRFFPAIGVPLVGWVATLGASAVVDWFVRNPWTGKWAVLAVALRDVVVPALFYLAIPVAVVERRGVIGSIVHGVALTRQGWIRVLVIVLGWQSLLWGCDWLPDRVLLSGRVALTSDDRGALVAAGFISLGLHLALSSLEAILAVVTYGALREEQADLATEKLAQAFE